jgi:hypothetical protein
VKRRTIMVVAACALVVAMLAPSPVPAAAASSAQNAAKVGPKPPKEAKPPKGGKGAQGPLQSIAEIVAKQAAIKFADFALNQSGLDKLLGDRTSLDALAAQIQGLSDQLKAVQKTADAILRDIQKVLLNQFEIPLKTLVSSVQSLYVNEFLPTIEALTKYADAIPDGDCQNDKSNCGKARLTFESTFAGFMDAAARSEADNITIHNFLMPGPTQSSALSAYGAFLMRGEGATGLLTTADSDRLYAFYTYYSEYEALATLMQGVRNTVRYANLPASLDAFIKTQVIGFQKLEQDSLPPRIAPNTVIALPRALDQRTTTKTQPMWIWDYRVGRDLAWDPATAAGTAPLAPNCSRASGTNRCTVGAAINTYNQTAAGVGFNDWRMPSRAEWDSLLTGQFDQFPHDLRLFLLSMFRDAVQGAILDQSLTTNPFVWTADMAKAPAVSCHLTGSGIGDAGKVVPVVHTALGTGGTLRNYPAAYPLTSVPQVSSAQLNYPRGLSQTQGLQWCRDRLAAMVTAGFVTPTSGQWAAGAQLIATRTTTVDYMP